MSYIRVSTVQPAYLGLHFFAGTAGSNVELARFTSRGLEQVYSYLGGEPADGACAFAPAAVVRDLLGIDCPAWRALHARPATAAERTAILNGFRRGSMIREELPGARLTNVCISRLDPNWASAMIALPSGGGVTWLRKTSLGWRSRYDTIFWFKGRQPSHAIVLSLAACSTYNAAEYGG